jgi:tRNA modification GTPase
MTAAKRADMDRNWLPIRSRNDVSVRAMISSDTIYALSSGLGRAGVAVVRISGPDAANVVKKLSGALPVPRQAVLRKIVSARDGTLLDRGLILWFPAPSSFTGEDVAEFHVHGGLAVVRALFEELGGMPGLRAAAAGEFTRRAFSNGKFDLVEVEGLADLVEARTERQRRQAIRQAEGSASEVLNGWRDQLVQVLARLEAAIDFVDEAHVSESALVNSGERLRAIVAEVEAELERGRQGERLREGLRVVLAGLPNVGKSSLLNWLAKKEAAIVSPIAGTTRDVVEAHLNLGGLPIILQDTAGLRAASSDEIEIEGIARANAALGEADLVLWVASPDVPASWVPHSFDSDTIWIWNKADLALPDKKRENAGRFRLVSAKTGEGIEILEKSIIDRLQSLVAGGEAAIITRQRHRDSLQAMLKHLRAASRMGQPLEIIAEEVRLATYEIGRLTGFVEVESLLDKIFEEFCIGK